MGNQVSDLQRGSMYFRRRGLTRRSLSLAVRDTDAFIGEVYKVASPASAASSPLGKDTYSDGASSAASSSSRLGRVREANTVGRGRRNRYVNGITKGINL